VFSSSKCSLFHNSNVFSSFIIHILYTGCAKIKKNNSGSKRLSWSVTKIILRYAVNKTSKSHGLCKNIARKVICDVLLLATFVFRAFRATSSGGQHGASPPVGTSFVRSELFPLVHPIGGAILTAQEDENHRNLTGHSVYCRLFCVKMIKIF
jgi:hypothetical protein